MINPPSPKNQVWVREGRCQQIDIWGSPFPPLSLAYIKAQLNGIAESLVLDPEPAEIPHGKVFQIIKDYSPEMMIMSTSTPTFRSDCGWFAHEVKTELPGIKIGAIGIHVTSLPEESLINAENLDFVIKGEPEAVVQTLILFYQRQGHFDNIPGICFRDNDRKIVSTPLPGYTQNIDDYGHPDWSDIDFNSYLLPIKGRPFSLISFSRGCPYSCLYCAASTYYGKKVRKRSVNSIISEIDYNLSLGVLDFLFWTEMISSDLDFLNQFLDTLIEKGYDRRIQWVCNSRVDQLSRELILKMERAGCWQLALGLEFGTDKALRIAGKGGNASVEKGRQIVQWADQAGIAVDGHFILGFPGETEKDILKTIHFAASLPLTFAHFYLATPFPGSKLYEKVSSRSEFSDVSELWDHIRMNKYVFTNAGMDERKMYYFIEKAYKRFYLSLYRMHKILKLAENPREMLNLISAGKKLLLQLIRS